MAVTISLSVETDVNDVRIQVGVPAGCDRLSLQRVGPSGTAAYVRGATGLVVDPASSYVWRDFEAPIGVELTYTATCWPNATPASTQTASATVTIAEGGCEDTWLTDLARPSNTLKVVVEGLQELAYQTPSGVHWVLNRRTPIVVADVSHAPTFELDFLTATELEREHARAALGNGSPVLLRTPPENGIGNLYFAATEFREQRIVKAARTQDRRFVVAGVQVDRPDPSLYIPAPPLSYAEIAASYATYAALAAAGSYDEVAWDFAVSGVADIVPWPPDDV